MLYERTFVLRGWVLFFLLLTGLVFGQARRDEYFSGQDLMVQAGQMTEYQQGSGDGKEHILLFEYDVRLEIGPNLMRSNSALVWIKPRRTDYRGTVRVYYDVQVYLEGDVSLDKNRGFGTVDFRPSVIEKGRSLVSRFSVSGEIFVRSEERYSGQMAELFEMGIYQNAQTVVRPLRDGPLIAAEAMVPSLRGPAAVEQRLASSEEIGVPAWERTDLLGLDQPPVAPLGRLGPSEQEAPEYQYPVNIAGMWEPAPVIESTMLEDGRTVTTVVGRFYLWQKQDEEGGMIEFQADHAVIYSQGTNFQVGGEQAGSTLGSGRVEAVYFRGNIVMTETGATIRADEVYYDFLKRQALAVKAERRIFDPARGVPIYMRAEELRQVSKYVFRADDVVMTTSEFFEPQVALHSSSVVLTDLTGIKARQEGSADDSAYDAVMRDVTFKIDGLPVFYWPKIRTDLERPDIPLKKLSAGWDSDYGATLETDWNLSKLLGRKERAGVNSVLAADYFGERGYGAGTDISYVEQNYLGVFRGYLLKDNGTDDLGLVRERRNLDAGKDIRGRVQWRHRHFLPYDWQATFEASYATDENYLEQFNRTEFETGKNQETLVHLKRIKDNWGFSLLNKFRITDHRRVTEELPTIEFHIKGQSFWDHKLTYYSDTQVSRLRELFPDGTPDLVAEDFYTFFSTRHEVDLPITAGVWKIVPFIAGTAAYNDFDSTAFDESINGDMVEPENSVYSGELGMRVSTLFWKVYPDVKSRLWNVNGLRHIVKPHAELVGYAENDGTFEMRDVLNVGVLQRWQTKRMSEGREQSVDWIRLDTNVTWLDENDGEEVGPGYFLWNNPSIPSLLRRDNTTFGPVRNAITNEFMWRVSDTTAVLSDMHFDLGSYELQQHNIGVSRYIYPDISYYVGGRYLKNTIVDVPADGVYEKGSYSVVGAMTYRMNSRYTLVFSQEYNIEYDKNVLTEVSFIRQYHRMFYALGYSRDYSRDRETVFFSIWPEGVRELALGTRGFGGITGVSLEE